MIKKILVLISSVLMMTSCLPGAKPAPQIGSAPSTLPPTQTIPPPSPTVTFTPLPTETITPTSFPFVDSLKAKVLKDKLICRYGPGKNYLYLFAYNINANIKIIGRIDGKNSWVLVENSPQRCWVDSAFLSVNGDPITLHPMYPDGYKIPVSPYYGPTTVLDATREGNTITIKWKEVIVSPGKYESVNMFPYIVEVWRCENGEIIFETLGSRVPTISFEDQPGCDQPSHGRVYIQEKHGYAGPTEIPWPAP